VRFFWATVTSNGSPYENLYFTRMLRDRCPISNVGVLWHRGWMDKDVTWYGGRPWPRRHCVRWESSSPWKGAQQPLPTFRPTSIVAKRSPISATAELLLRYASGRPYTDRHKIDTLIAIFHTCTRDEAKLRSVTLLFTSTVLAGGWLCETRTTNYNYCRQ